MRASSYLQMELQDVELLKRVREKKSFKRYNDIPLELKGQDDFDFVIHYSFRGVHSGYG
ncbi:MAG: hypothetical protein ACJZ10_04850 [Candidatus Neomarinimicrobiota bacterium]